MTLNSLADLLEAARVATPETIGKVQASISPAIVELSLTEAEAGQVFAALKEATGTPLSLLKKDFETYLRANDLSAERASIGTELVRLAFRHGLEAWRDSQGDPYATLKVDKHIEHHPLKSKAISRYLRYIYYRETRSAPSAQGIQDALGTLEAQAVFEGPEYPVFTRVAEINNVIYLDLANERWEVVRITDQGWEVIQAHAVPVRFRRPRGMLPLPVPERGGDLGRLAELLNVSVGSRDWKLIAAWLAQNLRGVGPYPLLVITGGQGSGKSTAAKLLRALVDPNQAALRTLPRDERDLYIAATNGWTLAFDNVSGLAAWTSDALCKLATGGGLATRELFSDTDETLLAATRPVILNGITDFVQRQDLVDRALQVQFPAIPERERRLERILWENFRAAHPSLLGALLDVAVGGLRCLPQTHLELLPRLADFALWGTACESALGWEAGSFVAAYGSARDELVKDALDAELVAAPLLTLLTHYNMEEWVGTASELLAALNDIMGYPDKRPPKGWPGAAHVLVGELKRLIPALTVQGLEVKQLSRTGKKGSKRWRFRSL